MKKLIRAILIRLFPKTCFRHTTFSQDGEDRVLQAFYEGQKKYRGFYIDVGAHHPFRFSNTALFYGMGWSGINIEPTPNLIGAFHRRRKRDINLNVAISGVKSSLTFYMFDEAALNSFNEELSEFRHRTTPFKIIGKKKIDTYRLSEVLDTHMKPGQKIDFMTIDVEGLDFEVLKSNDWEKYIPQFILVEQPFDITSIHSDDIYVFLIGLKYKLVSRTMRTSIYQHIDFIV
jgi:FkbM family methyltransferase